MSPKSVVYKTNSIIYFKGDIADRIFLLNEGRISLNFINIETGQELHEYIKTGEFFGVKSALGRYPREETALVLQDSKVIAFSVPEFEQLVSKNTRIIITMLKVFSNQLRRIHEQVQNLLYSADQIKPETGLFKIGQYYLKSKKYTQAVYVFRQYLLYYPSGENTEEATRCINIAEDALKKFGQGKGPVVTLTENDAPEVAKPEKSKEISVVGKEFYNALSMVGEGKVEQAMSIFKKVIKENADDEYTLKAQFETGKCFYHLRSYDQCIRMFTILLQKYPKHPDIKEALFFVAQSQEKMGHTDRAYGLYKKVLTMTPESDSLYRQVTKAIKDLEKK